MKNLILGIYTLIYFISTLLSTSINVSKNTLVVFNAK